MIVLLVTLVSLLVGAAAFLLTDGGWPEVSPLIAILSAIATALVCHIFMPALERRFGWKRSAARSAPPAPPVFVPAVSIPSPAGVAATDDAPGEMPEDWTGVGDLDTEEPAPVEQAEAAPETAPEAASSSVASEAPLPSWPPQPQAAPSGIESNAVAPSALPPVLPPVIPGGAQPAPKGAPRRAGDPAQLPLNLDTGV